MRGETERTCTACRRRKTVDILKEYTKKSVIQTKQLAYMLQTTSTVLNPYPANVENMVSF